MRCVLWLFYYGVRTKKAAPLKSKYKSKEYKNKSRVAEKMALSAQFLAVRHEYEVFGKSDALTRECLFYLSAVKSSILQIDALTTC